MALTRVLIQFSYCMDISASDRKMYDVSTAC